ncbi:MAG: hypothetical protein GX610_12760 [Rhodococcus sp.]|nr:hypothetical protein [Rhodococcus sp. (in: high G+C Gram-positive bacteria)]
MDTQFPDGQSLLIRTDFSNDALWQSALRSTGDGEEDEPYYLPFTVVDDHRFDGLTVNDLLQIVPGDQFYVFVADRRTMEDPEHPLLVVDTGSAAAGDAGGQTVRVTQPGIESIESNLSIANMDFVDFVDAADSDGVYRGPDKSVAPPQYQHLSVATLRAAVQRRQDLPLFSELLHDLDTDDHGETVLVSTRVDMEMYRWNAHNPPARSVWRSEGREDLLRAVDDLSVAAAATIRAEGRYQWSIVLDPETLEPIAADRQIRPETSG